MQIWQKWQNHMVMCNFAILRRSRCIPANFAHTKFRNHKSSSTSWWIYDNDIIINEFGKAMSERMFAKPKRCFRKLTNVFETQKLCREFERCWVQLISACRICESDFAGWEITIHENQNIQIQIKKHTLSKLKDKIKIWRNWWSTRITQCRTQKF